MSNNNNNNQLHPFHKFVLTIDKPIPAYNGYNRELDENAELTLVTADGNSTTCVLKDLIQLVNKHNLCVTNRVFENCDEDPPLYLASEDSTAEEDIFVPEENCAWGFSNQAIAWYKSPVDGKITALVIAPGYRLYSVKEDNSGIFVEDTSRDRIYIDYGRFHPALCFETKQDYFEYNKQRKMSGEYKFKDWDYILLATSEHNYRTINQLIQVSWPDFKQLLERYEQSGLDSETCLDEGNFKVGIPWIAFFKKINKSKDYAIVKAFLGVPGYRIDSIIPKSEGVRPGLNVVDSNGEMFWVSWSSWHDAFSFPDYKTFKEAKERGEIKYKRQSYANVVKTRSKASSIITRDSEVKPMQATAIWDVKATQDVPDEEVMSSLVGITPLEKK